MLDGLNADVLATVVTEHEQVRIAEFWENVLLKPSHHGPWLEGLNHRLGTDGYPVPAYILSAALQALTGTTLKGKALGDPLRALSLDQQRELLLQLLPVSRVALNGVLRDARVAFAPDFVALADECGSPSAFVARLAEAIRSNQAPPYHIPRYMELLTMLWSKGYVLFPVGMRTWTTKTKWATLQKPTYSSRVGIISVAIDAIKLTNDTDLHGLTYSFFAASGVTSAADWSPGLIDAYETHMLAYFESLKLSTGNMYSMKSKVTRAAQVFRLLHNAENPNNTIEQTRTRKGSRSDEPLRTDGTFRWLAKKRPDLVAWADAFRAYVEKLTTARIAGQVGRLNWACQEICV